jgi:hypothetical protein
MRKRAAQKAMNAGSRKAVGSSKERTVWGLFFVLGKMIANAIISSPRVTNPSTRVAHVKPSLGCRVEKIIG